MGQWKFQALANSREVQCEHHLVAVLFVCENFLLAGRRGRRPLRVCGDNLPNLEIFAVLFRFRAEFTERL